MIYRSSREEVENYHSLDKLNQSSIKVIIDEGMQAFLDQKEELLREEESLVPEKERTHFIIGKAVDIKITGYPNEFQEIFHISNIVKKPGEGEMKVLKCAFQSILNNGIPINESISHYKEEILAVCNLCEYRMNWADKPESRWNALFKPNNEDYWKDLVKSQGKQVLSDQEQVSISDSYDTITTHPFTRHLFNHGESNGDHIDIVYQFPMEWTHNHVECKAMPDMIIINHTRKLIIPIDFKTHGGYIGSFKFAIRKRRYDVQASFYTEAIYSNLIPLSTKINKHLVDYTIANFAFVVASTKKPGTPGIFPLDDSLLDIGKKGDGKYLLGWTQGIATYRNWRENNFDITEVLRSQRGVIWVGSDFDYHENFGG